MTTKLILLLIGILFSESIIAKDLNTWCAEVPKWPKGMEVPSKDVYEKVINVSNTVTDSFVKQQWEKINKKQLSSDDLWVIIDARAKKDRTQKISKTVMITSDYKDASKHEFNESNLISKIGKRLKKSVPKNIKDQMKFSSIGDLNKMNVKMIVFCNGPTCHRSTFGVCELNRLGVKRENINIFLEGFDGLKKILPYR